jgi:hypothetical protein
MKGRLRLPLCKARGIARLRISRKAPPVCENTEARCKGLSENSVVGPRASFFSPDKDGEAGDIGFIVDGAGCGQVKNKPLEARSSFQTEPRYIWRSTVSVGQQAAQERSLSRKVAETYCS